MNTDLHMMYDILLISVFQHKQVKLLVGYQVGITRELNKKSPLYYHPIYTITNSLCYNYTFTVHSILSSPCVIHKYTICILCGSNMVNMLLDIIVQTLSDFSRLF